MSLKFKGEKKKDRIVQFISTFIVLHVISTVIRFFLILGSYRSNLRLTILCIAVFSISKKINELDSDYAPHNSPEKLMCGYSMFCTNLVNRDGSTVEIWYVGRFGPYE